MRKKYLTYCYQWFIWIKLTKFHEFSMAFFSFPWHFTHGQRAITTDHFLQSNEKTRTLPITQNGVVQITPSIIIRNTNLYKVDIVPDLSLHYWLFTLFFSRKYCYLMLLSSIVHNFQGDIFKFKAIIENFPDFSMTKLAVFKFHISRKKSFSITFPYLCETLVTGFIENSWQLDELVCRCSWCTLSPLDNAAQVLLHIIFHLRSNILILTATLSHSLAPGKSFCVINSTDAPDFPALPVRPTRWM